MTYTPPLNDMRFVLDEVLDAPATLGAMPDFVEVDADLMHQILDEAGRFAAEVLAPLNAKGDEIGCTYADGVVRTPPGFADAYRQFVEAGWPALACKPEHGGQGLPHVLQCAVDEMLSSANLAWTMYPGLLHGAYAALAAHASEELKAHYLPKIVSGEWLATMCLTESHAGSDLGLLRTRAVPAEDGSYRLSGNKIFISGGESDMSSNIVHLVLARLPDAPAGTKGISLFLVPKFLPDGDKPGARNAVQCTGIEHKMGLHGSATSSMQFDNATGWIVGEPHRGLAAMFVMMNAARLHVGLQGLGIAEGAYQHALAYANERVQMKAIARPTSRAKEAADPIVMHPAVQRLLMTQRAWVEGGRMLSYWAALMIDLADHHPDADMRHRMHEQVGLITPIVKSMLTAQGFQGASQAMQVFGGHGFIGETGIEQYMRDVRITMIYEGTNEIQDIDFLMRKVLADKGERLHIFLAQVDATAEAEETGWTGESAGQLLKLTKRLRTLVRDIAHASAADAELPYRIAPEFMRLAGHVALGWLWLRAVQAAKDSANATSAFCVGKINTACYYFTYVFPEVEQNLRVIDTCLDDYKNAIRKAFPTDLFAFDVSQENGQGR
jgi:alkylation response protein AidB-like acyl-CoA dehydrogenase